MEKTIEKTIEKNTSKNRNSGVELLRIIAMFMVIGVHIFLYGNYYNVACGMDGLVSISAGFLKLLFRPGVNIFVIITGYFMVRRKFDLKKSYKRVLKIYLAILFYSVIFTLITLAMGKSFYTINGETTPVYVLILKMLFPVLSQQWYFISDYIILCLFAPFLNIVLQRITKSQYQVLLVISSIVMSGWFLLDNIKFLEPVIRTTYFTNIIEGKNPISFMFIYIIGGYIRLHTKDNQRPKLRYLIISLLCVVINGMFATVLSGVFVSDDFVLKYTNPLVILMAVCLLMYFKDLKFNNRLVNRIASTTLGIYALHEFSYFRNYIWDIFNFYKLDCSHFILNMMYIVGVGLIIFAVGVLVDLLRQKIFDIVGGMLGRNATTNKK